jgi:hypothetical protein
MLLPGFCVCWPTNGIVRHEVRPTAGQLQVEGLASNALGGLSKLQNLSITLQRRWSNVLSDAQRQHIVELFLGLRLSTYLPSAQLLYSATLPLEVVGFAHAPAYIHDT